MTVASNPGPDQYSGDDATTAFTVTNYFLADGDLEVVLTDSSNIDTLQTITTHYTVAGSGVLAGGTITMVTAPATGETLTIRRAMTLTQATDYVENDPFPADTHEEALDKLTMIAQELEDKVNRSLKSPTSSSLTDGDLTAAEIVADYYLKIDTAGTGYTSISPALASIELSLATTITPSDGQFIVGDGSEFVGESGATARTSMGVGTGDSPQFTAVNVGAATDTTVARVSAGKISVEGVNVVTTSSTDTLTNKTFDANGTGNSLSNVDLTADVTGTLPVASGGTGATTLTDGGVLLGSGTGAVTALGVLSDGEMIVGDGTTDPVAESGATLRTSIGVGTGDSPQFTGIEVGAVSDTTLTRASAGVLAVEGVNLSTAASTDTLTNKTFDANGTGNSLSNVDIADLADGTDGELITWDAAGAPAAVAVGTSTHVLTSNGVGVAPTFQAPAGGTSRAIQSAMEAETDEATFVSPDLVNFSPGVSKAWVKFTGVTTTAIEASHNITSLTDDGAGTTTITIATDFSSTDYAATGMSYEITNNVMAGINVGNGTNPAAGSMVVVTANNGDATDALHVSVIMMGDQA